MTKVGRPGIATTGATGCHGHDGGDSRAEGTTMIGAAGQLGAAAMTAVRRRMRGWQDAATTAGVYGRRGVMTIWVAGRPVEGAAERRGATVMARAAGHCGTMVIEGATGRHGGDNRAAQAAGCDDDGDRHHAAAATMRVGHCGVMVRVLTGARRERREEVSL
ncbi:hypothetical protein GUJ93_ZPchr0015g6704 [Zizania palustris]|uniref:Uncharacterized protein n=1 Tax=Zizania palustris TaxID=103762 RepID=A0A8J5SYM0_ZIZPA|nr:hypothetical protein GUJ93_ZPchr0015g6704 [Zizania palustris]